MPRTEGAADTVDVAICGGGLAGLTLARQLKRELPGASVAVIDKLPRPLPEATHKVGESTVETGAHYLGEILGLTSYFGKRHFRKLGLRYFYGGASGPLERRPEVGLSAFPSVDSYQIDRGILENDLRKLDADAGVHMLEGCSVDDILLAEDGAHHQVLYTRPGGSHSARLSARWVVDALGRRRMIQRKLGLTRPAYGEACSASWFRLEGRIDLGDLVEPAAAEWHARVPHGNRYWSTNHLMGNGYWVWLIPLASGITSVGIVAQEDLHPFAGFNTYDRALTWLSEHEPRLAAHIGDRDPLDFRCMRKYSYSSRQVFSSDRWACVGEAGVFPDPYYSPGIDLIGFANSCVTDMIRRDFDGSLTPETVRDYSQFVIGLNDLLTHNIHRGYAYLGSPLPAFGKFIWDITAGWSLITPFMFNGIFLDHEKRTAVRRASGGYPFLVRRMQQLFADWGAASTGRGSFTFIDYLSIPFVAELRSRNLRTGKTLTELVEDQQKNMQTLECLAQALFLLAVEDLMPERMAQFDGRVWLDAWNVGLDPDRWESDGLFAPKSPPRHDDLADIRHQLRGLLHFERPAQALEHVRPTAHR